MSTIQVTSEQFGVFDAPAEAVFGFPNGIPGFPDFTQAVLVSAEGTPGFEDLEVASAFWWLQSTTDASLAFLVVDPWIIDGAYEVDFDEAPLRIESAEDVVVLAIVSIADVMTANLRAPLVMNTKARLGAQVVLADQRWAIKTPMVA